MASIHIAGTPCTDWSSMGTQSGAGGLTMVFLFAWIGLRRLVQEPVIIQENVTKFCVSYLEKFIGDLYFIDVSVEQSGDFGVPCMRERQFIVCRHKSEDPWMAHAAERFHPSFPQAMQVHFPDLLRR